jgi:PKD repeat protein
MRIFRLSQTGFVPPFIGHRRPLPLIALLFIAGLSSLILARSASATTEPYGEVSHFGGFEAGEVAGKFDIPVGFTVEPENPSSHEKNAVYVLDRTLFTEHEEVQGELKYRLQKLSSTGTPLASAALPIQLGPPGENFAEAKFAGVHPLISLAVDPAKQRVYALVESLVESGTGNETYVPVADELVAWSTAPHLNAKSEEELVPAEESQGHPYSTEDSVTHAALVANLLQSEPSKDLYAPEGITVNPKTHEVVIEAQQGVQAPLTGGPTILQPVTTEGPSVGTLPTPWVASKTVAPAEEPADGLFTATNSESYGIDLFTGVGKISRLVDVGGNFASPSSLPIAEDASGGLNKDEAPTLDNFYTVNSRTSRTNGEQGAGAFEPYTAGSPLTQLTNNNLYAARYGHYIEGETAGLDSQAQVTPWKGLAEPRFWTQQVSGQANIANEGIRLFEADGHIVTTIGGQALGQECDLKDARMALAAGDEGSLFVLTDPNEENNESDDEVIEFAPTSGAGKCPSVGGHIEVNQQPATSTITVTQGKPVEFDAISIERKGETPFAFEWYFEGVSEEPASKTYAPPAPGSKIEAPNYKWPDPETMHTYKKAGTYEASVRLTGDYGTSEFPITVKVEPTKKAVAKFHCEEPITEGKGVVCDASASEPTPESNIDNYHWEFGDGTVAVNTGQKQQGHVFAKAGTYTVKLKVTDESKETAETEQKVTVAAAPATCVAGCPATECGSTCPPPGGGGGGGNGGTTTTTPTITPPVVGPVITKPAPKPLTRTQLLTKALAACKKIKSKGKRVSCMKAAEKKYAKKTKVKKSIKKK